MVFLHYDQAALDRQYDQHAWAANAEQVIRRYAEQSELVRSRLGEPRAFAYGETPAETLDLYPTDHANAPIHVFIHGGAWRRLGKRDSAFAAETFVRAGAHFVAPDFVLLPAVTLDVMVAQVRRAITWLYRNAGKFGGDRDRIFLSGHSSGGHLVACAATTAWSQFDVPPDVVKAALCASGIYDLEPVRLSARNDYVKLDERAVQEMSPQRHLADLSCPMTIVFGEHESDEFKRQARDFAAASGSPLVEAEGVNHFELAATLADPHGPMGRLAFEQMGLAAPMSGG